MPKDFVSFFSLITSRKVSFFGRIWSNFEFKKVTCCLYHSGTVRHSTVKLLIEEFIKVFRTAPNVIFSDGDPGITNAICLVFTRTTHLLCTFHITKNMTTHIKPLFSGQGDDLKAKWTKFIKEWWKICKKQDSLSAYILIQNGKSSYL